jgi:hypothetical protein
MAQSNSAVDALDVFATLAGLFIKLGGSVPEFLNHRSVWFNAKVGAMPATLTGPACDVVETTQDYWIDMAALAAEVEKQLVVVAERHNPPLPLQLRDTMPSDLLAVKG